MRHRCDKGRLCHWIGTLATVLVSGSWTLGIAHSPEAPERVIIKPRPDVAQRELRALHKELRTQVVDAFPALGQIQLLDLPTDQTTIEVCKAYQNSGLVAFAEPDRRVIQAQGSPNDPLFENGEQWTLARTPTQDCPVTLGAPAAWSIRTDASQVVVAIIDSGIRATHEDLADNLWLDTETGFPGFNALEPTMPPVDDSGHGTQMAGVIGAVGNNELGIAGVAWRVQLMACKFLEADGMGTLSGALSCFDYAITHGADVINVSWILRTPSAALEEAIEAAGRNEIVVVAAAGNFGESLDDAPLYPAAWDFEHLITVAATDKLDQRLQLSNFSPSIVDIGAPGESIRTTSNTADNQYQIAPPGTSIATAIVSGSAALLRAQFPNKSPAELIEQIKSRATQLPTLADEIDQGRRLNLATLLPYQIPHLQFQSKREGTPPTTGFSSFQLQLVGFPGSQAFLEFSLDLESWARLGTIEFTANGVIERQVSSTSRLGFYRLIAPSGSAR